MTEKVWAEFEMEEEIHDRLVKAAKEQGRTVDEIVEEIMRKFLEEEGVVVE